jgi:hypothetical protein
MLGDPAGQVLDEVEAGVVAPVNVLNHQEESIVRLVADEELREGKKEAMFLLLGVERHGAARGRQPTRQDREEWNQIVGGRAEHLDNGVR